MPNFKKFVALSLGAVVLLASCTRGVDANGAKKFINSNYSGEDTFKEIDKVQYSLKATCSDNYKDLCTAFVKDTADDVGCTAEEYKEGSLSFTCKNIKKDSEVFEIIVESVNTRISESTIDEAESIKESGGKVIYTTSGKEISIYGSSTINDEKEGVSASLQTDLTDIYAENGHIRYRRSFFKCVGSDFNYTLTSIYVINHLTK